MQTGFECRGVMMRNQVINYPTEVAPLRLASNLIKLVDRLRGWRSRVIGEIHDLDPRRRTAELDEVIAIAKQIATVEVLDRMALDHRPLRVEVAKSQIDGNWADMEEVA